MIMASNSNFIWSLYFLALHSKKSQKTCLSFPILHYLRNFFAINFPLIKRYLDLILCPFMEFHFLFHDAKVAKFFAFFFHQPFNRIRASLLMDQNHQENFLWIKVFLWLNLDSKDLDIQKLDSLNLLIPI